MHKTNKYEGLNVYYITKKRQKINLCPDSAARKMDNSTVKSHFTRRERILAFVLKSGQFIANHN